METFIVHESAEGAESTRMLSRLDRMLNAEENVIDTETSAVKSTEQTRLLQSEASSFSLFKQMRPVTVSSKRPSIVKRMTQGLLTTYKGIRDAAINNSLESIFKAGVKIGSRYQTVRVLGKGVFGLVVLAH